MDRLFIAYTVDTRSSQKIVGRREGGSFAATDFCVICLKRDLAPPQ
jgi:hypothetical protein